MEEVKIRQGNHQLTSESDSVMIGSISKDTMIEESKTTLTLGRVNNN